MVELLRFSVQLIVRGLHDEEREGAVADHEDGGEGVEEAVRGEGVGQVGKCGGGEDSY